MEQASPIFYLAVVTLIAGLGFAAWQYRRVQKAREQANERGSN